MRRFACILPITAYLLFGCASEYVCPEGESDDVQCDPTRINTRGWEDSPYLSLDGQRLYFMYSTFNFMPIFRGGLPERRGPQRQGYVARDNPFDEAATYVATRQDDGTWSAPQWLPLNEHGTTCCLMTLDDETYYFQRSAEGEGPDLVQVTVDGDTPLDPEKLGAANSDAMEDNPHVSSDQQVVWFTSARDGGAGGKDLWVSVRDDAGDFQAARNVSSLNTSEDEDQIWVRPDGQVAYFNRGGRIFKAERTLADGESVDRDNWGAAEEVLFDGVSIEGAEASLTADESRMVFARVDRDIDDITLVESERDAEGRFGAPVPLD